MRRAVGTGRQAANAEGFVAPAQWQSIRRVITAQRKALLAGNAEQAFAFASPPVRRKFASGAGVLRMVKESCAPLLEARHAEFLEGAVIDGTTVQPLRLVLPDNTVIVALCAMERQRDGRWRIGGCALAPSTVIAA